MRTLLEKQVNSESLQLRIEALRARFICRMREDREIVQIAWQQNDTSTLRECAHKLAGIAGSFGFADVGEAAAAVQHNLDFGIERSLVSIAVAQLMQLLEHYGKLADEL